MNTTGNIRKQQQAFIARLPKVLTEVPRDEWPADTEGAPVKAWRSRDYAVQLYEAFDQPFDGMVRLSICRSKLGRDGRWEEGLSWDELQQIKREVGYGDWYAIEVYPPDQDVINVANMRHLWLMLGRGLMIGWFK